MTRRIRWSNAGLKISRAGYDATTATEANLIFSSTTFMQRMASGGPFTVAADNTVTFVGGALSAIPLIHCTIQTDANIWYGMEVYSVTTTNFKCRPLEIYPGNTPALGKSCVWVAFRDPGVL